MESSDDIVKYGYILQRIVNHFSHLQDDLKYLATNAAQLLAWKSRYKFEFKFDAGTGALLDAECPDLSADPNVELIWELYRDHSTFCLQEAMSLAEVLQDLGNERGELLTALSRLPLVIQLSLADCRRGRHWVTIVVRRCVIDLERWPRLPSREEWRPNTAIHPSRAPMPRRVDTLLELFAEVNPTQTWQTLSRRMDGFIDDLVAVAWSFGAMVERAPDGPCGVNQWRYKSLIADGTMTNKQWSLASRLHERCGKKIHVDEFIGVGKLFESIQPATVQRHGSDISTWFADRGIPLVVRSGDNHIWMEKTKTEE